MKSSLCEKVEGRLLKTALGQSYPESVRCVSHDRPGWGRGFYLRTAAKQRKYDRLAIRVAPRGVLPDCSGWGRRAPGSGSLLPVSMDAL